MAAHITETLVSDLSGDEIPDGAEGGTVEFTISGQPYAVDLTAQEIATFNEVLGPYLAVARKVRGTRTKVQKIPTAGAAQHSRDQLNAIRSWARSAGLKVADRGRIPNEIIERYNQVH